MTRSLLNVAMNRPAATGGRVFAGEDMAGLSIAGYRQMYGESFAGLHPQTGAPLFTSPLATPAAAMGLSIAGSEPKTWQTAVKALSDGVTLQLNAINGQISNLSQQISSIHVPTTQELMSLNKREAVARTQGVLVHDPAGPRRNLLFSVATPGTVPAASGGQNGTATASGAPQKPFQPHRMIVAGAVTPTSTPGGTQGLLITAMFVGSDLQFVNVPGGQSGVPVDVFAATAFDAKFEFDAAYPAIGITINVSNPTSSAATLFNSAFIGKAIS